MISNISLTMAPSTHSRSNKPIAVSSPSIPKSTPKAITKKTQPPKRAALAHKKATPSISKKPAARISKSAKSASARCFAGGPNGPKVFDEAGFELSYAKCKKAMRPGIRRTAPDKYMQMLEDDAKEDARKCEIMGTPQMKVSALTGMAWDDRVARELGIPYHKVEMRHFEELHQKGFVGKQGEFEACNMSDEERERLSTLCQGSAFRK